MKSKIFKWNGILTENNAKKVGGQKLFHRDQQEFAFFQLKTSANQSENWSP